MAVAQSFHSSPSTEEKRIQESLNILDEGVLSLLEYLDKHGLGDDYLEDLDHCSQFIQQLQQWCGRMPSQRLREATYTLLRNLFLVSFQALEIDPLEFQKDYSIGEFPGEFLIQASIHLGPDITLSNDKMSAFLQIPSILLPLWNENRFRQSLENTGITNGIEEQFLAKVFEENNYDTQLRIARGKPPIPGQDAVIMDEIQLVDRKENLDDDLMCVDHREVHDFKPVKVGQVLFRKEPATDGESGFDVTGEPIPSTPGLDEKLPLVKNCSISQDGLSLTSDVDGCCYLEKGNLVVVPALLVPGNVDYNLGNIKTEVGVSVSGNVLSEFHVESQSDIAVQGVVEAAYLTAQNNIFCKGGVNGKEKAVLKAGNIVSAKYLNESTVKAGEKISVNGSIIHCKLVTKRVVSDGDATQIIGGTIYAWDDVCAGVLGSEIGVKTEIVLGTEVQTLEKKLHSFQEKLKAKMAELDKLHKMRKKLSPPQNKENSLSAESKKKIQKVLQMINQKKAEAQELEHIVKQGETELAKSLNSIRMVRAKKTIHPGTVITILDQTMKITETLGPTNIVWMDGKLIKGPYTERDDDEGELEE